MQGIKLIWLCSPFRPLMKTSFWEIHRNSKLFFMFYLKDKLVAKKPKTFLGSFEPHHKWFDEGYNLLVYGQGKKPPLAKQPRGQKSYFFFNPWEETPPWGEVYRPLNSPREVSLLTLNQGILTRKNRHDFFLVLNLLMLKKHKKKCLGVHHVKKLPFFQKGFLWNTWILLSLKK